MTAKPMTDSKRTIIITGASSGIGKAAARELAKDNNLIIVGRSEATIDIATELGVEYLRADYADLESVKKLAHNILKKYPVIDLLINNAGGFMKKLETTKDGFEQTVQVNYLAQFVLTDMLLDRIIESKGAIINTSSAANLTSALHASNIQDARFPYVAYSNSKLLDLIHAKELSRRYHHLGIDAVSFHPGIVATNFAINNTGSFSFIKIPLIRRYLKTPEQGADTLVWLANNRDKWESGGYYSDRKIGLSHSVAKKVFVHKQIWEATEILLGMQTRKSTNK